MDFSNILATINDLLNTYVPSSIAGVDTLYIALGTVIILLILWLISKVKKNVPTRELVDLVTEEINPRDFSKVNEDDSEVEVNEEDGFMPSTIAQEVQVTEQPVSVDEVSIPELNAVQTLETGDPVKESISPARQTPDIKRKKRLSTRSGRKISKADFSDFSGQRILIAEDNIINQKVINGVLNDSGIDVVMADDGQFVMDILEKDNDFEIILMDAHMPRLDGFEATRLIRANPAYDHIAVVALSGDTAVDDIRHMTEAGMEEHLEKPLKMDALYDVMSMYYTMAESFEDETVAEEKIDDLEIAVDINDLPCLDYDLGLDICGNDEEMYKELLKEFFLGYKDSSKRLREVLVQKDYKEAQNILIDVKGTASNLGAKQFINITERFLEALSEKNTALYGVLFKDYQAYLLALLKSIQQAFKN